MPTSYLPEMDLQGCAPGLRFYPWILEKDRRARLENQHCLREPRADRGNEVELFCSHDVGEFERLASHPPASLPGAGSQRAARNH